MEIKVSVRKFLWQQGRTIRWPRVARTPPCFKDKNQQWGSEDRLPCELCFEFFQVFRLNAGKCAAESFQLFFNRLRRIKQVEEDGEARGENPGDTCKILSEGEKE